jgi:ribosomal protein L35
MIQVAIRASGVCHTDLHAAEGDWPVKPEPPFIPGHEGVGYVSAVGKGVKNVKEGDRVGVPWLYTACGCCRHCLGGWETLCESQQNTGYSVNGGLMHAGSAMRHNLEHKSARKRRELKADGVLATSQSKNMKKLLGR